MQESGQSTGSSALIDAEMSFLVEVRRIEAKQRREALEQTRAIERPPPRDKTRTEMEQPTVQLESQDDTNMAVATDPPPAMFPELVRVPTAFDLECKKDSESSGQPGQLSDRIWLRLVAEEGKFLGETQEQQSERLARIRKARELLKDWGVPGKVWRPGKAERAWMRSLHQDDRQDAFDKSLKHRISNEERAKIEEALRIWRAEQQ